MKIKKTFQGSLPENKILNSNSTSQTDTYSCDYINKVVEEKTEVVLYEDEVGTTGDIPLLDNIFNYKKIEVYFTENAYKQINLFPVEENGEITLFKNSIGSDQISYFAQSRYKYTANSLNYIRSFNFSFSPTGAYENYSTTNNLSIKKVIGYK